MVTWEEIKSLPAKEKWLIFSALQDDADVLREIYKNSIEGDSEDESDLTLEIDEEKILEYIQLVDNRVAAGTATYLSMEDVQKRLKAKRNAYKVEIVDIVLHHLDEAIYYFGQISPRLGLAFENEAKRLFLKLSQTPNHYFTLTDGIHKRISIKKFSYLFVYQIKGEIVLIKLLFPVKSDPAGILALLGN